MDQLIRAALDFASEHHAGQQRDADDQPFVLHPQEVSKLLSDAGEPDHIVAAGALHDIVEDTDVEVEELEQRFGAQVANLVASLTDDASIADNSERRAALRKQVAEAGVEAATVFAADKISKSRELRYKAELGRLSDDDRAKIEHYVRSLEMLDETIPGHPLVETLRGELDGFA
jgi:(p)ppGpp synthase/HD superfamily hydrolase